MRKTLFWLFSVLLFALPAVAQRGQHGGQHGNSGGGRGGEVRGGGRQEVHNDHQRSEPRRNEPRNDHRGTVRDDHTFRNDGDHDRNHREWNRDNDRHEGFHWGRGDEHGGARNHWRDGRFEDHWYRQHYGENHRFFWGRCNWWGPRFYVGSYFWYNDAYFVILDPIPAYWYDDEVIVIYDSGYYWLVNPMYPGVRIHIDVRF